LSTGRNTLTEERCRSLIHHNTRRATAADQASSMCDSVHDIAVPNLWRKTRPQTRTPSFRRFSDKQLAVLRRLIARAIAAGARP
jgi:hypothetical protein